MKNNINAFLLSCLFTGGERDRNRKERERGRIEKGGIESEKCVQKKRKKEIERGKR